MAGYVSLSNMPSAKREYVVDFPQLNGGLNLQELDYRIQNDESPEMQNLWWEDGVLGSRDGQVWINSTIGDQLHAAYERIWNGKMVIHSGVHLYKVDPETGERVIIYTGSSNMTGKGTFFSYSGKLYYKCKGYYIAIDDEFNAADVDGYTPITYINCSPMNGSGDVYQPENRISANKTLWYNAAYNLSVTSSQSTLSLSVEEAYFRMQINTPGSYTFTYNSGWKLNGTSVDIMDYGIRVGGTPSNGITITARLSFVTDYYLPVAGADITKVVVDGVTQTKESSTVSTSRTTLNATLNRNVWRTKVTTSGTYNFVYDYDALPSAGWKLNGTLVTLSDYGLSYTASPTPVTGDYIKVVYVRGHFWIDDAGVKVVFFTPPPVTYPETNNTVQITYSKENAVAYNNIMDCEIVKVYGGTGALCIAMAGSDTQPNAYFWNGQTSIAMDATYFPMTQYQLAGDITDPITGFGIQQGFLIIFKEGSVGRTTLGTTEVDGRTAIDMPYVNINAKIGCDLPWSIQLIENNLTWANTRNGVCFLANTSAAYENNVIGISQKINESSENWNAGLLNDLRSGTNKVVISHDDEKRYWLVVGNHVWLWDYFVSNYKNPSWFYFTNIGARAFVQEDNEVWHFDDFSRLTKFERCFYDYDPAEGAINKIYRFATQYFGTYDNKKNVNSVIINTRSDTNSIIRVHYLSDYETREDLTPLNATAWRLIPRDLSFRNLKGSGFAHVFRRKPHCRRVQYFTMRLENNIAYMDMTIVSAQIYYVFEGRHR